MATEPTTCYRHPDRETGVSCSSCGRSICPDCMTPTPVGMRCPECAKQKTKVRTAADVQRGEGVLLTQTLIGINVVAFIAQIASGAGGFNGTSGTVFQEGVLFGPLVAEGEWWRLVTSGFLHSGFIHLGLNMYLLWVLGNMMEPGLGRLRLGVIYMGGLLGGALGVLIASPLSPTLGASGAVFGLMGAAFLEMRSRGIDPMQSGIGPLILINLVISFVIPGISIGGHIGGLIGGGLTVLVMDEVGKRAPQAATLAVGTATALALGVGGIIAANSLT